MTRARPWQRLASLGLLALSSALAIGMVEFGLRWAVQPSDFLQATLVADPVLGQRIEPHSTGHDGMGFRNAAVPQRARVIAIGDSNTYGVSAPREGSWPAQLGGLLGEPVYNMGLGGFGPLQYLHLSQHQALELKPEVIVVGVYMGNDLMDAYYVARDLAHWHTWRQSTAASAGADAVEPEAPAERGKRFGALRDWLSRHSVLYAVLRGTVFQRWAARERDRQVAESPPNLRWAWSDPVRPDVRTVFTPHLRLAAQDLRQAAPAEGLRIGQRALLALNEAMRQAGVKVLVAFIPTKERAYCAYLKAHSATAMPPEHSLLCDREAEAQSAWQRHLQEQGVATLNLLPALEAQIAGHQQLYLTDADGHPQAAGYSVIARAVATALRERGWASPP